MSAPRPRHSAPLCGAPLPLASPRRSPLPASPLHLLPPVCSASSLAVLFPWRLPTPRSPAPTSGSQRPAAAALGLGGAARAPAVPPGAAHRSAGGQCGARRPRGARAGSPARREPDQTAAPGQVRATRGGVGWRWGDGQVSFIGGEEDAVGSGTSLKGGPRSFFHERGSRAFSPKEWIKEGLGWGRAGRQRVWGTSF